MENKKYKVIEFKEYGDERGKLVVAEGDGIDIPFSIKRAFYMYGSDSEVVRGQHANRLTEFVLINVAGSSEILVDDGYTTHDAKITHLVVAMTKADACRVFANCYNDGFGGYAYKIKAVLCPLEKEEILTKEI